jgi:hypothetical protein
MVYEWETTRLRNGPLRAVGISDYDCLLNIVCPEVPRNIGGVATKDKSLGCPGLGDMWLVWWPERFRKLRPIDPPRAVA